MNINNAKICDNVISSSNLLEFLPQLYICGCEIVSYCARVMDRNPFTDRAVALREQRVAQPALPGSDRYKIHVRRRKAHTEELWMSSLHAAGIFNSAHRQGSSPRAALRSSAKATVVKTGSS